VDGGQDGNGLAERLAGNGAYEITISLLVEQMRLITELGKPLVRPVRLEQV
jgi:hypothetical protein